MKKNKKIIFGNWKLNKNKFETKEFFEKFNKLIKDNPNSTNNVIYGIAPSPLLVPVVAKYIKRSALISQNCYFHNKGAFTGEVSIKQLLDYRVKYSLVGHSERRNLFNEKDYEINRKIEFLILNNVVPILCIGETIEEFETNKTNFILENQLREDLKQINFNGNNIIFAYEPIWAIGTGKVANNEIIETTVAYIRKVLKELYSTSISNKAIILYGGSVSSANINELNQISNINGYLVGGASLNPESFFKLISMSSS